MFVGSTSGKCAFISSRSRTYFSIKACAPRGNRFASGSATWRTRPSRVVHRSQHFRIEQERKCRPPVAAGAHFRCAAAPRNSRLFPCLSRSLIIASRRMPMFRAVSADSFALILETFLQLFLRACDLLRIELHMLSLLFLQKSSRCESIGSPSPLLPLSRSSMSDLFQKFVERHILTRMSRISSFVCGETIKVHPPFSKAGKRLFANGRRSR